MKSRIISFAACICAVLALSSLCLAEINDASNTRTGYYRQPTIHDGTIVFVAEGDLWKLEPGQEVALRLTTHPGLESMPAISPDGRLVAFTGQYEGPTDAYVMPLSGGLPTRITYFGRRARVAGWTPSGKVLVVTYNYATLPSRQLVEVDPETMKQTLVPLAQAAGGCYNGTGKTLFFVRLGGPGSFTKRYKGGTAQNLWKFTEGAPEAVGLTTDYPGTSSSPMWYEDRVYFVSDRDGTMNLWSADEDGGDLRQHSKHVGWDVKSPSLSNGKIVYQLGADLYLHDITSGEDRKLTIRLASDFDQLRENWIDKPIDYMTTAHLSPDGEHVVITARGDLFVFPRKSGRMVEVTNNSKVRYRGGRYLPDGKSMIALTDATGELEFWKLPANGIGEPEQLTDDGTVFRFDGIPSPDGRYIACKDHDEKLWIHDVESGTSIFVDSCAAWGLGDISWSPDSRWLAYVNQPLNFLGQIYVFDIKNRTITPVTSERFIDSDPCWSPDGKWLYFVSERDVNTI